MNCAINDLLNLPNMNVNSYEIEAKTVTLMISFQNDVMACPDCEYETNHINQRRDLKVRDLSILGKQTILHLERRQYSC